MGFRGRVGWEADKVCREGMLIGWVERGYCIEVLLIRTLIWGGEGRHGVS